MTMTHKDPQLVIVRWYDAEADIGWDKRDGAEINDKTMACSVGWLIAENNHTLMLVADTDDEGNSNRSLKIPRVCVESVNRLNVSKAKGRVEQ